MQCTKRLSMSITFLTSSKYLGIAATAPLTLPTPSPTSQVSASDFCAPAGPRLAFHRPSPRAAFKSAGLPSCKDWRYSLIASCADFCWACTAPATKTLAASASSTRGNICFFFIVSPQNQEKGQSKLPLTSPFKQLPLRRCGFRLCYQPK